MIGGGGASYWSGLHVLVRAGTGCRAGIHAAEGVCLCLVCAVSPATDSVDREI
jgi:hypothetical protein